MPSGPDDTKAYGFEWNSPPDPTGNNLQGTYGDFISSPPFHNDAYTADQAVSYLQNVKTTDGPFCLTVGFVNPHDREFFPARTEFVTFSQLFARYNKLHPGQQLDQIINYSTTPPLVDWATNKLKSPRPYGYPILPPNWEDPNQYAKRKPAHILW